MKWIPTIARVLMGLVFAASGIFAFATHFAVPPGLPENLQRFVDGLAASVYFMPFLKGTEIVCGLLLISGAFVPLAPYLFRAAPNPLGWTIGLAAAGLFSVGAVLSLFTGRNGVYSGARMLVLGAMAGAITFAIGHLLGMATG